MAADGSISIDTKVDDKGAEKGIGKLEKKISKSAKKMQSLGKDMSKYITAPLVALGTAGFIAANDLDKAYATIRAGTGATGDALDDLSESFKNVFEQVPQSADEVSSALADLNTRTGATGEDLEKLTKQFLDLGRVAGEDVSGLIASGTRAFGDWGIEAEKQAETMDYFWKVSQTTGIGVTDLMNKMVQFGAPLRQMGFDFDTSAALLGKFEKEGVNAELVMGSMRQALGKMAREGIGAEEGLQKTMDAIKNAGSTSEANAEAIELFGARAGPDMAAAIREGRFEIDDLIATMGESSETIEKAGEDTLTLGDRFGILKNNTTTALEPIGSIMIDLAEQYIPPLIEAVQKVAEWFKNLSPEGQKMVFIIGAIIAVIPPLIVLAGSLGLAILGISWPILAVIAGIAALIAIGVLLWQNWETIKTYAIGVWTFIGAFFSTLWTGIKATFKVAIDFIFNLIKTIWEGIKTLTSVVWNGIAGFFSAIWNTIKSLVKSAVTVVKNTISNIWNTIKSVTSSVWNGIKSTITGIWDGLKSSVSNIFNSIKDTITGVWDGIKSATSDIWNGIVDTIKGAINGVISVINGMLDGISSISISSPKVPDWVPKYGGKSFNIKFPSLPKIPSLDVGTDLVTRDGLAMIHAGEKIVPADTTGPYQGDENNHNQSVINVYLGTKKLANEIVEDVTYLQDRKKHRKIKLGGAH